MNRIEELEARIKELEDKLATFLNKYDDDIHNLSDDNIGFISASKIRS